MKYIKLFMLLGIVTLFAACSSDSESWNSASNVTVGFESSEVTVSEGTGIFNLPISVKGAKNGNVSVTIEAKEIGSNPAKEDVHYYITGKTINISDSVGNVEIETVDDEEINEPRTFMLTIVDAKGATISGNPSVTITLKDNDAEFYTRLQGDWIMTGENSAGTKLSWNVKITGAKDESEADYNKTLTVSGINGYSSCEAYLSYHFDTASKAGYVAFEDMGEYAMGAYAFGEPVGNAYVIPMNRKNGSLTTDPIIGQWSDDMKTITFGEGMLEGALYSYPDVVYTGYRWFNITNIVLTKK